MKKTKEKPEYGRCSGCNKPIRVGDRVLILTVSREEVTSKVTTRPKEVDNPATWCERCTIEAATTLGILLGVTLFR